MLPYRSGEPRIAMDGLRMHPVSVPAGRPRRSSTLSTAKPQGRSFSPRTAMRRRPTLDSHLLEESTMHHIVKATPTITPPRVPTPLPRIPTMPSSSPISLKISSPYETITSSPQEMMYSSTLSSPSDESSRPSTPTPKPRQRPVSCPIPKLVAGQQPSGHRRGGGSDLSSTISSNSASSLDWPPGFHRRQPDPSMLPQFKSTVPGPNRITLSPKDNRYALVPNIRHPHWTAPETYSSNMRKPSSTHSSSTGHHSSTSTVRQHNRKSSATGPKEVVYDLTSKTFRHEYRSTLIPPSRYSAGTPLAEYPEDQPPMHCDGRMTIVTIPRWKREMKVYERILVKNKKNTRTGSIASGISMEGSSPAVGAAGGTPRLDPYVSKIRSRVVKLPLGVWAARNFGFGVPGLKLEKVEDGVQIKWRKSGKKHRELFVERA